MTPTGFASCGSVLDGSVRHSTCVISKVVRGQNSG